MTAQELGHALYGLRSLSDKKEVRDLVAAFVRSSGQALLAVGFVPASPHRCHRQTNVH